MIKEKLKKKYKDLMKKYEVCLRLKFRNKPYKSFIHMDTMSVPNSSIYGNKFIFIQFLTITHDTDGYFV